MTKATKSNRNMTRLERGEPASVLRRPVAYALRDLESITASIEADTVLAKVLTEQLTEMADNLAQIRADLGGIEEVLAEAERREADHA